MAFRCYEVTTLTPLVENLVSTKTKFMQMLDTHAYKALVREAEERGASIQELLRTVIIPDWLMENKRRDRR